MCRVLREVVEEGLDWKPVADSEDWTLWSRLALKLGETSQSEASFLLSTLCTLCAAVYRQNPTGSSAILEMLFSHSQFLKVMLAKPSSTKGMLKNYRYLLGSKFKNMCCSTVLKSAKNSEKV